MDRDAKIQGSLLYVEDDQATRSAIAAFLARRVDKLFLAENGRIGLEQFERHAPDLVVTDITMPGMDGMAMAQEIKTRNPMIPVIVTTAYSDTPYLLKAIEIGIDGYVLKPVDFARLEYVVLRQFALVHQTRQVEKHQEEQARLLEELQVAAKKIKTLSNLLSICASCKKIRDKEGQWTQLEQYIAVHANVLFSHGLCPDCLAAAYRELDSEIDVESSDIKKSGK